MATEEIFRTFEVKLWDHLLGPEKTTETIIDIVTEVEDMMDYCDFGDFFDVLIKL